MIRAELLSYEHIESVYQFERDNRIFFERTLPSRGDDYYVKENFIKNFHSICDEQNKKNLYMHVICNEFGEVLGRVNLFPVENALYERSFELGYRMGEKEQGKGYASTAVRDVLTRAFYTYDIDYVMAATSPANMASQIVLLRNGLKYVKRVKDDIEINGQYEDSVIFERMR